MCNLCLPFRSVLSKREDGSEQSSDHIYKCHIYNCLPNKRNVVPPIGLTLRGPILVSQIVMAN